jgi:hypothetical protein
LGPGLSHCEISKPVKRRSALQYDRDFGADVYGANLKGCAWGRPEICQRKKEGWGALSFLKPASGNTEYEPPNFNSPGKERIVITNAASPACNEGASQNQPSQGATATLGENWQQQIEEMVQPAIVSIQQQVAQAAEQQLEPLRSRVRHLAEQQLAGAVSNTLQRDQLPRQGAPDTLKEQGASQQEIGPAGEEKRQDGKAQQQANSSSSPSLVQASAAKAPARQVSEEEPALQRWGGTLEDAALMMLAVGEVLDGVALIMQAMDELLPARSSSQREQNGEPSSQEEQKGEGEGRESLFQKLGRVFSAIASALRQMVSRLLGGGSSAQQGLEGVLASLPQWGRILEHASALLQALGDSSSSKQEGLSSMKKWGPIVKHGTPLVKELGQVLGGLSSQQGDHGGGTIQRWGQILGRTASVLEALGDQKQDDTKSSRQVRKGEPWSNQEQDNGSSPKQGGGGISSALQSLAGGTSSQKKDNGGSSSLLDALTGEASPLQMLREFSKRQQGPGGLAPKGPIGRKPPPGPLRRDRIPYAE